MDDLIDERYYIENEQQIRNIEGYFDFISEDAKDRIKQKFSSAYDSKILLGYIEKALFKVKEHPGKGELYYDILNKQYFTKFPYTEDEMLEALHMERSVFYDKKRDAVALFSLCLWGYLIPEYHNSYGEPLKTCKEKSGQN